MWLVDRGASTFPMHLFAMITDETVRASTPYRLRIIVHEP